MPPLLAAAPAIMEGMAVAGEVTQVAQAATSLLGGGGGDQQKSDDGSLGVV